MGSKGAKLDLPSDRDSLQFAKRQRSAVHVFAVGDFVYRHFVQPVIDEIDNPVLALPHPVTIDVTCKLFRSGCPGIARQALNSLDNALAICLGAERLNFLCRRGFDQEPISGHAV